MVLRSDESTRGTGVTTTTPARAPSSSRDIARSVDHRGSPLPNGAMISTRIMELRKRRGLMAALLAVFIGVPTIFLGVLLLLHAVDPRTYGPAGGYQTFSDLVDGILFVFGFIVAATLGCTAGSVDLTEGVFRHLVVTGRSRVALYLARIPAGLAILVPLVAVGFTIVCTVCVFAAPPKVNYEGLQLQAGLSRHSFVQYAENHYSQAYCQLGYSGPTMINLPCGDGGHIVKGPPGVKTPTKSVLLAFVGKMAGQNYAQYSKTFRVPPISLMVETGLWIELEAALGFIIGLGLASVMGQRTVPIVLMIVLEVILTPILLHNPIDHFVNAQRALVGLAMNHIEPSALPRVFGGMRAGGGNVGVTESTPAAISVIVAWAVGWTALGAWRMAKRDA
jgi:hypothetical protein